MIHDLRNIAALGLLIWGVACSGTESGDGAGGSGATAGAAATGGGSGSGTGGSTASGGTGGSSGVSGSSGTGGTGTGGTGTGGTGTGGAGTGGTGTGGTGTGGAGGTGTGGAGTGGTGTGGTGGGTAEVKVAFIGDTGNDSDFESVLDLVLAEGAAAVLHNGDFDYGLDPDGFFATVDGKVGANYPYFTSVGNHDAPSWSDYSAYAKSHLDANSITLDEPSLTDQKFAFHFRGLHFVLVGENGSNTTFASFIDGEFAGSESDWRICGWHKNQAAMQIGGKGDEMGWGVYESCRQAGAIVTTGHEHSYERTKTLTNMASQTVDTTCSSPTELCLSPGRTFAVVSGLGGVGVRDQERCLPATPPYGCNGVWASIYTSNQGATYGALFIVFNVGGDPKKAHGYFKNVDGDVIDEFDVTRP